jgi:hypothetical protein
MQNKGLINSSKNSLKINNSLLIVKLTNSFFWLFCESFLEFEVSIIHLMILIYILVN